MEFPDISQSRYSWPPMSTQCGPRSTDSLRAVHSPVRSGSITGLLSPAARQYSNSCGDLRESADIAPPYRADRGAQGDGPHIQNPGTTRPMTFSFWEEMQSALGQAHKRTESGPEEQNADTELSSMRDSTTTSTHRYSDKEFQSMNVFLKSFDLNDADINTKKSEKIIIEAIKAGMFFESKRKGSHLLDNMVSGSARNVSASEYEVVEKYDVEAEGDYMKALPLGKQQRRRFQGDLSKGRLVDTPEQCNSLNDKKTSTKAINSHRVTKCAESSHAKPKCKNISVTFANDGDISSDDLSHNDQENDNIQHPIDEKLTYQGRGRRDKWLENQTMLLSEVCEKDNVSALGQNGNGKGKMLQKNTAMKRTLQATHSSSAVTYRVELEGKHFNGKVVGKMFIAQDGESMTSEHGLVGEVTLVAPSGKWSSADGNEEIQGSPSSRLQTKLVGKVFTLKVVSLDSDQAAIAEPDSQFKTDAKETRNVNGIKQARDPGNDTPASTVPPDCGLCLVKFTSVQHANLHYSGKAHHRRAAVSSGAKIFTCDACNVIYTSQKHSEQHVLGRKHRNMVASLMEPVVEAPVEVPQDLPLIGETFVCRVCSITTNSRQNLTDHLNGAKHLKKLSTLKVSSGEENTELNLADERIDNNANRLMSAISKGIQPTRSGTATLDVPTNSKGPRVEGGHRSVARSSVANEQACHSGPSTSHVPMPITFQVPKSKFNLSNLKMVRTVGTQFTNTNSNMLGRDLTCQEKLPRINKSMLESNSCRGNTHCVDAPYCACDPTTEGLNILRGSVADWQQPSYKQQAGCRKFKKCSGAL